MKKVLIVDDELLVRMGFRSILDWESCGFTVSATRRTARKRWKRSVCSSRISFSPI